MPLLSHLSRFTSTIYAEPGESSTIVRLLMKSGVGVEKVGDWNVLLAAIVPVKSFFLRFS
jgi:hypothetical protein